MQGIVKLVVVGKTGFVIVVARAVLCAVAGGMPALLPLRVLVVYPCKDGINFKRCKVDAIFQLCHMQAVFDDYGFFFFGCVLFGITNRIFFVEVVTKEDTRLPN